MIKTKEGKASILNDVSALCGLEMKNRNSVSFENDDSIVLGVCKRPKNDLVKSLYSYGNSRYIVPTSNLCDRFFSKAGYALNSRRMSVLPSNIGAQMFFQANRESWNVADVSKIVPDE